MLCWLIDIYTRVDDVLVEGTLLLVSTGDRGHIWVEIKKPYSDITIESHIRNGGRIGFGGEWVNLNDPDSGITISSILAFIYNQCKQFELHKEEIREMYNNYIFSSEYEPIEMQENIKSYLNGKIVELEEKMDLDNPHDPNWKEHDDLWMRYYSLPDIPQVSLVEEIQDTYNIEGSRDFVISLIKKFIDEFCDWW